MNEFFFKYIHYILNNTQIFIVTISQIGLYDVDIHFIMNNTFLFNIIFIYTNYKSKGTTIIIIYHKLYLITF